MIVTQMESMQKAGKAAKKGHHRIHSMATVAVGYPIHKAKGIEETPCSYIFSGGLSRSVLPPAPAPVRPFIDSKR